MLSNGPPSTLRVDSAQPGFDSTVKKKGNAAFRRVKRDAGKYTCEFFHYQKSSSRGHGKDNTGVCAYHTGIHECHCRIYSMDLDKLPQWPATGMSQ